MNETLERWSSRRAFILAVTGAAVGLGNIWRFPYMTGENGGAAFLLLYVVFVVLLGLPVMMAEILIGRAGRRSPMRSLGHLARRRGLCLLWRRGSGIFVGLRLHHQGLRLSGWRCGCWAGRHLWLRTSWIVGTYGSVSGSCRRCQKAAGAAGVSTGASAT